MLRPVVALALVCILSLGCRSETDDKPTSSGTGAAAGSGGMGGDGGMGGGGGMGGSGAGTPSGAFTLTGTIVTPDEAFEGQVRVVGDIIDCVAPDDGCRQDGDTLIETGGVIAPGLIDTHNHILFDIFDGDDWGPAVQACSIDTDCDDWGSCNNGNCACVDSFCKYQNHDQWPNEDAYALMLDYKQCLDDAGQGKPPWCPQTYDGDGKLKCEMVKWGEMKGLIAGTTSIVGLPGVSSKCFGSVARSIDVTQNDLEDDKVQTAAVFPSNSSADGACANFADGDTDAYLIHVAEGFDQNALDEWEDLNTITTNEGCLISEQTAITHGSALTSAELDIMAMNSMKLIWSPASNMSLYGRTTDIPAVMDAGLTIALAPDWSMGGSQNLLDELRFAESVNDTLWNDPRLSPEALVQMVTAEAARVLALDQPGGIGRLAEGYKADLVVFDAIENDPFMTILSATPAEVALVMVGGVPLYGEPAYLELNPASASCDVLDICGDNKFLCVAEDSLDADDKLDQRFDEIETALQDALLDIDSITALPPSACNDSCDADEECFERTVISTVPVSNCGGSCPAGEECFQQFMSGNNQYACLTPNTCYAAKNKGMAPLTPLIKCQ